MARSWTRAWSMAREFWAAGKSSLRAFVHTVPSNITTLGLVLMRFPFNICEPRSRS